MALNGWEDFCTERTNRAEPDAMTDNEFLAAFENCSLPFEQWNHRAHVRVAYQYAARHDVDVATQKMRSGVQAYNAANNIDDAIDQGYHETITQAFMRLLVFANRQTGPHSSAEEFCQQHPDLLDKRALLQFYSRERIMTWEAKARFVEPDLCPLPIVVGNSMTILNIIDGDYLAVIRQLFIEYAHSLDFNLCFQDFDDELNDLPGSYSVPAGRLLLLLEKNEPVGCVALRPLDDGICEMKRLWVRPNFRGRSLGRYLAEAIIQQATTIGYKRMRLDTVAAMKEAISLYRSLGFVETEPYAYNPIPGAVYLERELCHKSNEKSA